MATFVSKYHNLKMIVKPTSQIIIDNKPIIQYGRSLEFSDGEYTTNDKDIIHFLRNHDAKGRLFYEVTGNEGQPKAKKTVRKKGTKVATS